MISWMQKHNKYLIVTIWVATIAFIGAGFVGWGSYQYGSKAGSIAKIGDIDITREKFDLTYRNTYQRYNQMMQGQLDEKKAKELGVSQQAFNSLASQALLLNLANEFGIVVSDEEIYMELHKIPAFQTKNVFVESVYKGYLKTQRLKAKDFESIIHDELIVKKLFDLLDSEAFQFEQDIVASALGVTDKIAYKVLSPDDINKSIDETQLKEYWQKHKSSYMTPKRYQLDILWTDSSDTNVTDTEIMTFYNENSFNYIDSEGKQLLLENIKERIAKDLKLKKSKKKAQKAYIGYKKGQLQKSETVTIVLNDVKFTPEIWESITSKDINSFIKPKVVSDKYASIKLVNIIEPAEMKFEEAKKLVSSEYENIIVSERLEKKAELLLKNFDDSNATVSEFLSLNSQHALTPLNNQNSQEFLQKLFTSQKEKGIISINKKIVIYKVLEQKMDRDENSETKTFVTKSTNQIKNQDFQSNLIKSLKEKYKIEKFVEGI